MVSVKEEKRCVRLNCLANLMRKLMWAYTKIQGKKSEKHFNRAQRIFFTAYELYQFLCQFDICIRNEKEETYWNKK